MAIGGSWGKGGLPIRSLDAVGRDLFAGVICSALSIAFALSFAALIFSGPLTPWLAYGIAASFIQVVKSELQIATSRPLLFEHKVEKVLNVMRVWDPLSPSAPSKNSEQPPYLHAALGRHHWITLPDKLRARKGARFR
jgi:hypothetical protein